MPLTEPTGPFVIRVLGTPIELFPYPLYVKAYTPAAMDRSGNYLPGGDLAFTSRPAHALQFADAAAALRCYRQERGRRPDGKPNRPLTSYTVEIMKIEDAKNEDAALYEDSRRKPQ
jgi:hypothetical protein